MHNSQSRQAIWRYGFSRSAAIPRTQDHKARGTEDFELSRGATGL